MGYMVTTLVTALFWIATIVAEVAIWRLGILTRRSAAQAMVVLGLVLVFFASAAFSELVVRPVALVVLSLAAVSIPFVALACCFLRVIAHEKEQFAVVARAWVKSKGPGAALVLLYSLVSRFWLIGAVLSGDSSEYAAGVSTAAASFDFTLKSLWKFRVASHPSFSFSFFTAPGYYLSPESQIGVQVVQQVLTVAAMLCIYLVLYRMGASFQKRWSRWLLAALTTITVFTFPLLWAMDGGFTTDYFVIIFFCFLLYCDSAGLTVLTFFAALAVGFTKENSWVLLGSYWLFKTVAVFLRAGGNKTSAHERLFKSIFRSSTTPIFAVLVIGFISLLGLALGGRLWVSGTAGSYAVPPAAMEGLAHYNGFGIDLDNVTTKVSQIFVLDFAWLTLAVLVVSVIVLIAKKEQVCLAGLRVKCDDYPDMGITCGVLGVLLASTCFNALYINAGSSRYAGIGCFALCFIVAALLNAFARYLPRGWGYGCSIGLTCIFAIQAFLPVDPLSNLVFETRSIGGAAILNTGQKAYETPSGMDYYMSNLQYLWQSKAFELVLKESGYSQGDIVLTPGNTLQEASLSGSLGEPDGRLLAVRGNGIRQRVKGWDPNGSRYINNLGGSAAEGIRVASVSGMHGWTSEFANIDANEQEHAALDFTRAVGDSKVILYFDSIVNVNEDQQIEYLSKYFNISDRREVRYLGWKMAYYIMSAKPAVPFATDNATIFASQNPIASVSTMAEVADQGGVVNLIDPATASRADNPTEEQITTELIGLTASSRMVAPDGYTGAIKVGSAVNCRLRFFVDGVWQKNPQYPDGFYRKQLSADSSDYLGGLGESLVGKKVGDIYTVHCSLSPEYDQLVPGIGSHNVDIEVVVTKVYSTYDGSFEDLCSSTLNMSYEDCRVYAAEQLKHAGIGNDDVVDYVVAHSPVVVSTYGIEQHKDDFQAVCMGRAKALGISLEEYVTDWLHMDDAQFTVLQQQYAEYQAKRDRVYELYSANGYEL